MAIPETGILNNCQSAASGSLQELPVSVPCVRPTRKVWKARLQLVSPSTPSWGQPSRGDTTQRARGRRAGPRASCPPRPPQLHTWPAPVRPHPPPGRPQDPPHAVSDSTTVPAAEPRAAAPPWPPGHSRRCARETCGPGTPAGRNSAPPAEPFGGRRSAPG